MPYAFNLELDDDAALQIERVYASLARLGVDDKDVVSQYGPCVTFLIVDSSVHQDDVIETLVRLVPRGDAIATVIGAPCVIAGSPPTLGLRVEPSAGLLALHHAVFSALPTQSVHLHYRPAYWQPHVKLANVRADGNGDAELLHAVGAEWPPLTARLQSVQVMRYPPVELLWQAPLRNRPEASPPNPIVTP